jgi:hypothetical protein
MIICLYGDFLHIATFSMYCLGAGKELEQLALSIGFSDAKFYEISGGLMGNLVATC